MERVSELLRCRGAKMGFEDEVGVSGGQSQKGIQGKAMAGAKALRHSRAGVCGAPTCSGVSLPRQGWGVTSIAEEAGESGQDQVTNGFLPYARNVGFFLLLLQSRRVIGR